MKTFIVSVIYLIIAVSAMAERILVNEDGEIRVQENVQWRILSGPELQAYQNPGTEIPVWETSVEEVDFFHHVVVSNSNQAVVFDGEKIKYVDTEKVVAQGEPKSTLYKILLFAAIGLMIAGNLVYKKSKGVAMIITFVAFGYTFAAAFPVVAAVAFAAAAFVFYEDSSKIYITCSSIFYIACLIALFV